MAVLFYLVSGLGVALIAWNDAIFSELLLFIVIFLWISAFSFLFSLNMYQAHKQLHQLSTQGYLTNIGNRRAFDAKVVEILALHKRSDLPVSLIYFDINHFK